MPPDGSRTFWCGEVAVMCPSAVRSSGSSPTPARMAPVMERLRSGAPATVTWPAVQR
ncbi:hypothetical protein GCM10022214_36430 [Actinomadura miaoliensis]|uniref:Uncharacterized protein n=1 Tax=Actinomadura miaoliensis TaxID=430685 RepID=A0ABP7VW63_9ACTN